MGLAIQLRIDGKLALDVGEVAAHAYAVIRQGAAGVDERDQQDLAAKLVDPNGLGILIEKLEVGNLLAGLGNVVDLGGLVVRLCLLDHVDLIQDGRGSLCASYR